MKSITQLIKNFPYTKLADLPTPIHHLARLGHKLGNSNLYIKRDDLTGLALGGNKVRKLEYLLADALSKEADSIILSAAAQSNMVRMTAAGCAKLGLETYAVLRSMDENPPIEGNLLLDTLFGAHISLIPTLDPYSKLSVETMQKIEESLIAQGKHPYIIDLRYHSAPIAALGYFSAVEELDKQFLAFERYPSHLFLATGSGSTQAGLLLGIMVKKLPIKVIGISVQKESDWMRPRIMEKLKETATLLSIEMNLTENDIIVDDRWIGESYAIPTDEAQQAIQLAAKFEGLILDPVYSGKAFSGLIGWIKEYPELMNEVIVFLHSGGVPALFVRDQNQNIIG